MTPAPQASWRPLRMSSTTLSAKPLAACGCFKGAVPRTTYLSGQVLGEGTFLSLLWFIERVAPDPIMARVPRLAAQDEARHDAFGMSHLREHISFDPSLPGVLTNAVRRRHESLRHTAGLNAEAFDALVLMAAGSWEPASLGRGHDEVAALIRSMHINRKKRLIHLGFDDSDAEARKSNSRRIPTQREARRENRPSLTA